MKKKLLIFSLLLTQKQAFAQITLSYFPFASLVSVASNSNKRLFIESKLETNNFVSNLNFEFSPKFNFTRLEKVNYYVGIGASINPFNSFADLPISNGYFIDFGARVKPIEKISNFQFVFEISPYVNRAFDGGNIRSRLGLAWNFTRKQSSSTGYTQ